jgi:hypothetical protein
MDIDGRLNEAGHLWREGQGPALRTPKLVTSPEKAPPQRWRRGLIPLAASLAVAGVLIGAVSLHGTASSSHQVPTGSVSTSSSVNFPPPKPTASTSPRPSSTVTAPRPSNTVALPPTAAATSPTRVLNVRPVDASGHLAVGYSVQQVASGGCSPGSEVATSAYRCDGTTNHVVYDPCWAAEDHLPHPSCAWAHRGRRLRHGSRYPGS